MIKNIVTAKIVDRMFPEIKAEGIISKELSKNIRIKVKGIFVGRICYISRNAFDSIFISMFIGLQESAIYNNYFFIMNAIAGFVGTIMSSLIAGIGNSIARTSKEDNYNTMMLLNKVFITISGLLAGFMISLYQPFMKIWVGEELMVNNITMMLFPIYFYTLRISEVRNLYSDAAGLFWENRYKEVGEAVCNIILNYILVKYFGIFGIVAATIITVLVFDLVVGANICFKHYFKNGKKEYFLQQAKYAVAVVAVCAVSYYITNVVITNTSFLYLIIRFIICGLLIPSIYILVLMVLGDYKQVKRFLIGILKK